MGIFEEHGLKRKKLKYTEITIKFMDGETIRCRSTREEKQGEFYIASIYGNDAEDQIAIRDSEIKMVSRKAVYEEEGSKVG